MTSSHKEESGVKLGVTPTELVEEHNSVLDSSQQRIIVSVL